ncbi:MAG: hypothetical protein JRI97_02050 [Deltaproteobacteria bacterium]|nr:hypothetical protein [Deltaproteobacteria bacterium]
MKIRFVLSRDDQENKLIIREMARRPDEADQLLGTREFDIAQLEQALSAGKEALVQALRSEQMYPPAPAMEVLTEAIGRILGPESGGDGEISIEEPDVVPLETIKSLSGEGEEEEEGLAEEDEDEVFDEDEVEQDLDYTPGKLLQVEEDAGEDED